MVIFLNGKNSRSRLIYFKKSSYSTFQTCSSIAPSGTQLLVHSMQQEIYYTIGRLLTAQQVCKQRSSILVGDKGGSKQTSQGRQKVEAKLTIARREISQLILNPGQLVQIIVCEGRNPQFEGFRPRFLSVSRFSRVQAFLHIIEVAIFIASS